MKGIVLGFALVFLTATASLATTYRIDVTGRMTDGFTRGSVIYDLNYNQVGRSWEFNFAQMEALGLGSYLPQLPSLLTGSALYDPQASVWTALSDCEGLLGVFCSEWAYGKLDPQTLQFSFSTSSPWGFFWGFDNKQFNYLDDRENIFRIGDLIYMGLRQWGYGYTVTFDTTTVSAIPVPPGVALGLTSVAALGTLGAIRRRRAAWRAA